jgi:predicted alpha-1,2-mannosidase
VGCALRQTQGRLAVGVVVVTVLLCLSMFGVVTTQAPAGASSPGGAAGEGSPPPVGDPSGLVDPIDGTGTGPVAPGAVGEFPGADVPFGMIQWSPDTTPNLAGSGAGYSYTDSHINGFSLTHLSGSGCASYGDVPILPTVGPIGTSPVSTEEPFSHATEHASPGRYGVTLGSPAVTTQLAVTTRTGLSSFAFPRTDQANVLFKVADSANPVTASRLHLSGHDEITGSVTSGQFCGTGTDYTLYFAAQFDRTFTSAGTWSGASVEPGRSSCSGTACGAYVTFDATSDPVVLMKVGISFVSAHNALDNVGAEDPGWSIGQVEREATDRWNTLLDRARVGGGTPAQQRTFTTALYHSLLFPNVVSDDNGEYDGPDGRLHRVASGAHYSNFSEWDIYRSEVELVSLLAPAEAGDMVESLVNDAQQGGWLPKWAIVDGDASQMNGDSADPIIVAAYAFGVRGFDVHAALEAMVKGATQNETGHGFEIERQYLSQYLSQHYVTAGSLDLTSIDYSIGGSVTLEYALDDFSIAQLAQATGDHSLYLTMMERAHNWQYLFDGATGTIQARGGDGSFPPGPGFQSSLLEAGGELGFEEGNALQYTWSVPQDLSALASLMGGDTDAVAALNTFFTALNAGRDEPYDWAGDEPSLWTPWEYDYFGAPSRTQEVVRSIADTLYANAPDDEPGNDDLGALSSWYVWAAMGLYPVTPGTANLALASPLFPKVTLTLPDGRSIVMRAPAASATTPYVHTLEVSGVTPQAPPSPCGSPTTPSAPRSGRSARSDWCQPWLPSSILTTGGTLTYGLSSVPDPSWASAPAASPPSYGSGRLPVVGFTTPGGATSLVVGQSSAVRLGVQPAEPTSSTVDWDASGAGLTVTPSSGRFVVDAPSTSSTGPGGGSPVATPPLQTLSLSSASPGSHVLDVHMTTADGTALPPVVLDVDVTG